MQSRKPSRRPRCRNILSDRVFRRSGTYKLNNINNNNRIVLLLLPTALSRCGED
jgi:hypothetical protein